MCFTKQHSCCETFLHAEKRQSNLTTLLLSWLTMVPARLMAAIVLRVWNQMSQPHEVENIPSELQRLQVIFLITMNTHAHYHHCRKCNFISNLCAVTATHLNAHCTFSYFCFFFSHQRDELWENQCCKMQLQLQQEAPHFPETYQLLDVCYNLFTGIDIITQCQSWCLNLNADAARSGKHVS